MGNPIPVPKSWTPCDRAAIAKNWTQATDGTQQRQTNRADSITGLAQRVNHLLGLQPRVMFTQAYPMGTADVGGLEPLHLWTTKDAVPNGRTVRFRILAHQRTTTNTGYGTANAYVAGIALACATGRAFGVANGMSYADMFVHDLEWPRGAKDNSERRMGVATYNGYTIMDIAVEDRPLTSLDPDTYDAVAVSVAPGQPILAAPLEAIRSKFHAARNSNLTLGGCWSAVGITVKGSAPGNAQGLCITSTSFVNVMDQSYNSRTATSPGMSVHAAYCGRGPEWTTNGRHVKLMCRVVGEKDSADHGVVRFEGPNAFTNNVRPRIP